MQKPVNDEFICLFDSSLHTGTLVMSQKVATPQLVVASTVLETALFLPPSKHRKSTICVLFRKLKLIVFLFAECKGKWIKNQYMLE